MSRKRLASRSTAVASLAMMTVVAGCSDNADSSAEEPTASASVTAGSPRTPSREGRAEETAPESATGDQSTPEAAVATLITAIIEDDKRQACMVIGSPVTDSGPVKAKRTAVTVYVS